MKISIAEPRTRHSSYHGYRKTPHGPLDTLLRFWRGHCEPYSGADPAYPEEIRDDVLMAEVGLGRGYVLAGRCDLVHPAVVRESDPMFESVFAFFRPRPEAAI